MIYLALILGKIYYFFAKNKKSDRVGLLLLTLEPNFLEKVKKPKTLIAVTGTNGKTTTCNMIVDTLEKNNIKVLSNKEGANVGAGIAKALMKGTTIFNKSKNNIAVIEFDEISSKNYLPKLKPNYLIVTNLSQDTMSRNGHVDYVFNKINEGIPSYTTLILNGDDLITSNLGFDNKKIYFGIDKNVKTINNVSTLWQDLKICPNCYNKLNYEIIRYNHIGSVKCPNCSYTNKNLDYKITDIDYKNNLLYVNDVKYNILNNSIFNIYNELICIAISNELKLKNLAAINQIELPKSRYYSKKIGDKEIISQFAKGQSPIAVSNALDYVKNIEGLKDIILILDDQHEKIKHGDSENTSWIYAADFEILKDPSINKIIIGGERCYDYKVRLLLASVDENKIITEYNELDTAKHVSLEANKIIVIHDLYNISLSNDVINLVEEVIK